MVIPPSTMKVTVIYLPLFTTSLQIAIVSLIFLFDQFNSLLMAKHHLVWSQASWRELQKTGRGGKASDVNNVLIYTSGLICP